MHYTQNGNLPNHLYGFVCREILRGLDKDVVGQFEACVVFGVTSIPSRALHFSILCESGAQWARIPLHMLRHHLPEEGAPVHALGDLQCWDAHGWSFSMIAYEYLREMACTYRQPSGEVIEASYLATLDWTDNGYSLYPPEHKCAHLLLLEDGSGQIAAMPNNRIRWRDHSFTDWSRPLDYRVMGDTTWHAETMRETPHATAMTTDPAT